jgi:hypothetical protein
MLSLFSYKDQAVRVVGTPESPEWVAKDVCEILGLGDVSQALDAVKPGRKGTCTVPTPGGNQQMLTLKEAGLYELIFKPRKPEAEAFRDWVFDVVLPQIRKTGSFGKPETHAEFWALVDGAIDRGVKPDTAFKALAPQISKLPKLAAAPAAQPSDPWETPLKEYAQEHGRVSINEFLDCLNRSKSTRAKDQKRAAKILRAWGWLRKVQYLDNGAQACFWTNPTLAQAIDQLEAQWQSEEPPQEQD